MPKRIDTQARIEKVRLQGIDFPASDPANGYGWIYYISGTNSGLYLETADGTRVGPFITEGFVNEIYQSGDDITITNTVTETDIIPATQIDANSLGSHKSIHARILCNINHGIVGTLTIRAKYGSTTIATCTFPEGTVTASKPVVIDIYLSANGGTSAQYCIIKGVGLDAAKVAYGRAAEGTASEDSTTNLNFSVTGQWGAASSSLTFTGHHMLIEGKYT